MIKKYDQFINESILDELKGPSEEEVWNELKELLPNDMLAKSAEIGYLKGIKKALKNGAKIHAENDDALIYAAENGHLDIIKYLVEQGADIEKYGQDAYNIAISSGYTDVARYLNNLKNKLTESILDELKGPTEEEIWNNLKDLEPNDLLDKSLRINFLKGVKNAIALGADIYIKNNEPIRVCFINGYIDIINYLIDNNLINIHFDNEFPLRVSSKYGYFNIVKILVENGANVNTIGDHPLASAANYGYFNIVKYLVEHGAKIHAENNKALRNARENNQNDIVEYLKKQIKKEKVNESILDELKGPTEEELLNNIKSMEPKVGLSIAIKYGYFDVVKDLLKSGVNPNITHHFIHPIDNAILYKQYDILYYLLKNGSDIDYSSLKLYDILARIPSNNYKLFLLILYKYRNDKLNKFVAHKLLYDNIIVNPEIKNFLEDIMDTEDSYFDSDKNYRNFIKKYINKYDKEV